MKRCLLHRTKLDEFKEWLASQDIPVRPGKGSWQLFQIQIPDGTWQVVFETMNPEHLSMNEKLVPLVQQFLNQREDPYLKYVTDRNPTRPGMYACRIRVQDQTSDKFLRFVDGEWEPPEQGLPWSQQSILGWIGPLQRRIP